MIKILVIDDDQAILNFLRIFLLQTGKFDVHTLQDSSRAFELLGKNDFDIVLLDMDMPNVTGLDILTFIRDNHINIITIVLTGVEDIDLAISAMKLGTFDYMLKPIEEKRLIKVLDSAIDKLGIKRIESEPSMSFTLEGLKHKEAFKKIITQSEEILKIFHIVEKFSTTDNSVLIWGESGTGKELIAQAIHKISDRREKKFVAVNSGAFANELFASEFFGHTRRDSSKMPMAERFSWMKSVSYPFRFRSNSCEFSRKVNSSGWGRPKTSRLMFVLLPQPIKTFSRR
jgi:DNA-binding NtrC family response regulator